MYRNYESQIEEVNEMSINLKERTIKYKGQFTQLNSWLIDNKNLNDIQIARILQLHLVRMIIVDEMKNAEPSEFKAYSIAITDVDFKLQREWGFEEDSNFHCWFDVPHCTCPKMDNKDAIGTPYAVINGDCPVHTCTWGD